MRTISAKVRDSEDERELYVVEIDVEGINVTNLNMTEIQTTISDLTGIEADKLKIQVDTNDNNEVTLIVVIVDTCCCCDLIIQGDLLRFRKLYGYVLCRWPIGMMML